MPPVRFETAMLAGERRQIYTLDRAVTGTGKTEILYTKKKNK
jgi:late competence protein required for DNA uptake (superfamily II DNA/RNA helicase)